MALNYDKVTIEWYDIHYISKLERQPDGERTDREYFAGIQGTVGTAGTEVHQTKTPMLRRSQRARVLSSTDSASPQSMERMARSFVSYLTRIDSP